VEALVVTWGCLLVTLLRGSLVGEVALLTVVVGIVAAGVAVAGVGDRDDDRVRGSWRNNPERRHLESTQ